MATITIYVSRNGNSYNLKLRDSLGNNPGNDNLTTSVSPGDSLIWCLDPTGSNLTSLNGVNKTVDGDPSFNPNSIDLIAAPGTHSVDGIYYGTVVSPSPGSGKFENYKIGFKVPNDDNVHWDDPKLQMQ